MFIEHALWLKFSKIHGRNILIVFCFHPVKTGVIKGGNRTNIEQRMEKNNMIENISELFLEPPSCTAAGCLIC